MSIWSKLFQRGGNRHGSVPSPKSHRQQSPAEGAKTPVTKGEVGTNCEVVSRATVRLTDGHPGDFSTGGAVAHGSLMATHRRLLDDLVCVHEGTARLFMNTAGVSDPISFRQTSADKVFANVRSAAIRDDGVAEIYFLTLPGNPDKDKQCLYAHYEHSSGYLYGVIVCKLQDGSFLAYNDGEIGKRLGLLGQ